MKMTANQNDCQLTTENITTLHCTNVVQCANKSSQIQHIN